MYFDGVDRRPRIGDPCLSASNADDRTYRAGIDTLTPSRPATGRSPIARSQETMRLHSSQNRLIAALFIAAVSTMAASIEVQAAGRKVLAEAFTGRF